jgi:hypothetical protein
MNLNINVKFVFIIAGILSVIIVYIVATANIDIKNAVRVLTDTENNLKSSINENENPESKRIIKELSTLLNQASNKIGQLSCQLSKNEVSDNGGWCSKISGKNSSQHMTDISLSKALSKFLVGKRVASFGDGPGVYKELLLSYNEVLSYDSFDGAPYAELTTNNNVKFLDLSVPIYHLDQYDWIISLEVAEHIPEKYESVYLDNLVRHSREGIILSWAAIGQGGHSHVNNRDFPYVKAKMEERDYMHDETSSKYLKDQASFGWFKNNINVYTKK